MQIRSKRERFLVICAVAVVIIAIWLVATPSPKSSGSKVPLIPTAQAIQKREVALRDIARMQSDDIPLQRRINAMAYDSHMPAEQLVPHVIRDLYQKAAKAGIHLQSVKPLRAKLLPGGRGARVPLEVRFRARFQPNVMSFLYYTEDVGDSHGKMVVDKVNITSADTHFSAVDVTAQVTVFTLSSAGVAGGETGDSSDATEKATKS